VSTTLALVDWVAGLNPFALASLVVLAVLALSVVAWVLIKAFRLLEQDSARYDSAEDQR
jgi:hypothetical protein